MKHRNGTSYTNISSWNYIYCIINCLFVLWWHDTSKQEDTKGNNFLSQWATATSLLSFIQGVAYGHVLGHHNCTSSLSSHSMWRLKPMDVSWVCMTLSPRMNSSVILVTNTQVVSGCHSRVSYMKASFKTERVSTDTVCRVHCMGRYLLVSPAVVCPDNGHRYSCWWSQDMLSILSVPWHADCHVSYAHCMIKHKW
jgi:hypothetical protein